MEGLLVRSCGEVGQRSVDPPPVKPIRVVTALDLPFLIFQLVDQVIHIFS